MKLDLQYCNQCGRPLVITTDEKKACMIHIFDIEHKIDARVGKYSGPSKRPHGAYDQE